MTTNEESNGGAIIPTMRYNAAVEAIDWLCRAFGFQKHLVVPDDEGGIAHAQLTFGNGMIMLGSIRENEYGQMITQPNEVGGMETQSPYIVVSDVDSHCEQARAEGATVVIEPEDQDHGGRFYSCKDPEGHLWNFGSYDPWG